MSSTTFFKTDKKNDFKFGGTIMDGTALALKVPADRIGAN
jgi:hypothetical protein